MLSRVNRLSLMRMFKCPKDKTKNLWIKFIYIYRVYIVYLLCRRTIIVTSWGVIVENSGQFACMGVLHNELVQRVL
jgi:hypothetical protein